MRNRIVRIVTILVLVLSFALVAGAHSISHTHYCSPQTTHGIITDSYLEGHSRAIQSSVWPGAWYDIITNHYSKPNPSSSWYYTHYHRNTCW